MGPRLATTFSERKLLRRAAKAGYRVERGRVQGCWQMIDMEGELVRGPAGQRSWSTRDALKHLASVTGHG